MTILSIVQDACIEQSLERPATLFPEYDEGDTTPHDMLRALTRAARDLRDGFDWSVSKARTTITALGAEVQTGKLPADFHRLVLRSFWSDGLRQEVCGPLSDEDYAEHKSGTIGRINPAFMIQGGDLLLVPAPTAGDTFSFSYIRTAIGKTSGGTRLAVFTDDADVPLWDDELMTLATVVQYRKIKKYDTQQENIDFLKCRADRIKRDGGGKVIHMGGGHRSAHEMVERMKSGIIIVP